MAFGILRYNKPVKLAFYTNNAAAHRLFPPQRASKKLPSWLQDEQVKNDPIKSCFGMRQMFLDGIAIPMWADVQFTVEGPDDDKRLSVSSYDKTVLTEPVSAFQVQKDNSMLLKLFSPWQVESSDSVTFSLVENLWSNPRRPLHFMSGTVEFRYQHSSNMFLYVPTDQPSSSIEAGDCPMVLVPKTERAIDISVHYDPEKHDYLLASTASMSSHRHHRTRDAMLSQEASRRWRFK
jgi:hypothetical protein